MFNVLQIEKQLSERCTKIDILDSFQVIGFSVKLCEKHK